MTAVRSAVAADMRDGGPAGARHRLSPGALGRPYPTGTAADFSMGTPMRLPHSVQLPS